MTTERIDYNEVYIKPLNRKEVKSVCINCLKNNKDNKKRVILLNNEIAAYLTTCTFCENQTLEVSKGFLGKGNYRELIEYKNVLANWVE